MKQDDLPERWRKRVTELALSQSKGKYRSLGAGVFADQSLRLSFPDGSTAFFRYAFALRNDEAGELAVFTEHCGYHIFPSVDTEVTLET